MNINPLPTNSTPSPNLNTQATPQDALSSIRENFLIQMANDPVWEKTLAEHSPFPIAIKTLPNGLTVYFLNRKIADSSQPIVSMQMVAKTGHLAELPKERGLAHFLEHCVYLGTQSFSKKAIEEKWKLYSNGTGADNNATTTDVATTFYFNKVPGNVQSLEDCLTLLYELIFKPTFPEEEVRKEREVLQNEFAMRENFQKRALRHYFSNIYPNEEFLRRLNSELNQIEDSELGNALRAFRQRWYQPHNLALILVGDLGEQKNADHVLAFIENLYGHTPPSAQARGLPEYTLQLPAIPRRKTIQYSVLKDKEYPAFSINFQNRILSSDLALHSQDQKLKDTLKQHDLNIVYQSTAIQLFSKILQTRLLFDAKGENSPFLELQVVDALTRIINDLDMWQISLLTKIGKTCEAYKRFLCILKQYTTYGVTKDEFMIARSGLKDVLVKDLKKLDLYPHDSFANRYQGIFLDQPFWKDPRQFVLAKLHMLDRFEPSHLKEVISHWDIFSTEKEISIMEGLNFESESIESPVLEGILKEVKALDVQKPLEVNLSLDWLPARPLPCSPVKTRCISSVNKLGNYGVQLHTFQFANGIEAVLAPVKSTDSTIHIEFIRPHHGMEVQTKRESLALTLAFDCLTGIGLKNKSFEETSRSLNNELINYFVPKKVSNGWEITTITRDEKRLERFLQVIYLWLTDSTNIDSKDFQKAFKNLQQVGKQQYIQFLKTPRGENNQRLSKALYHQHPLLSAFLPEDYEDESLYSIGKELLKKHLRDLVGSTFVICGAFNLENATTLIHSYLGQLESQPLEKTPGEPFLFPKEPEIINAKNGVTPDKTSFSMYFPLSSWQSGREHVRMSLARNIINDYLLDKIRYENQQAYTLSTRIQRNHFPGSNNLFIIQLEGSSQQHERVKKEVLKTLDELFSHFSGLSPNEKLKEKLGKTLVSIKTANTNHQDQSKQLPNHWREIIRNQILGNLDFATMHDFFDYPRELEIEHVLSELKQICDLKKPSISFTVSPPPPPH